MVFIRGLVFPKNTRWLQWVGGIGAMMMMFVIGLTIGWSSPYLAQFLSGESSFPATVAEVSWIALAYQLGRLPGAIAGAISTQYFGTKTVMISNGCGLIISWILVIVANSTSWLYVARFIAGAAIEVASISFPLFLGDISSPAIRGALVTLALNGLSLGILTGNVLGPYTTMRIFGVISLVPSCGFVLIFLLMPQSPYYLLGKGETEKAEKALVKYCPTADVNSEMSSIKEFVAEAKAITFTDRIREFGISRNLKSVLIVIALCMFAQNSGLNPVAAYMETIMTRAMVTVVSPAIVPIIGNSCGIVSGWFMIYLSDKCGRKRMWVFSSAGVFVSMMALGTHFYLMSQDFDLDSLQWLPIFSMVLFHVFFHLGLNSIPAILNSEIFAPNIRTLAASFSCASTAVFAVVSIYSYQYMLEVIDEAFIYWIFAGLMVISFIFGLLLIPEMKGRTLFEIQNVMAKK